MKREPLSRRSVQLTDTRILHDSTSLISQHLSLHAEGYSCHSSDLWQVLLTAAARQSTIEVVCTDLLTVPHANTIRGYLHDQLGLAQIGELEARWTARKLLRSPFASGEAGSGFFAKPLQTA